LFANLHIQVILKHSSTRSERELNSVLSPFFICAHRP